MAENASYRVYYRKTQMDLKDKVEWIGGKFFRSWDYIRWEYLFLIIRHHAFTFIRT